MNDSSDIEHRLQEIEARIEKATPEDVRWCFTILYRLPDMQIRVRTLLNQIFDYKFDSASAEKRLDWLMTALESDIMNRSVATLDQLTAWMKGIDSPLSAQNILGDGGNSVHHGKDEAGSPD